MTLSLSSCVCPLFFSLVSLKSVAHLECYKASKSVKGIYCKSMCVSRVFQECFECVSRVFQGCFKGVSRKFQGCFSVSRKFKGCFKEVSKLCLENFQVISRKL